MIDTQAGNNGEAYIKISPDKVSLLDIVAIMEKTSRLNRCPEEDGYCSRCATDECPVHDFLRTYVTFGWDGDNIGDQVCSLWLDLTYLTMLDGNAIWFQIKNRVIIYDNGILVHTQHTADESGIHNDDNSHWYVCKCVDVFDKEAHVFKWVTDKAATVSETGLKHEECIVCGYEKEAVEIPMIGSQMDQNVSSATTSGDKSDGANKPNDVKTGDEISLTILMVILMVAASGAAATIIYSKRRGAEK